RGRFGEDLIAVHRNPVTARRGDVAHRHDQRFVRLLDQLDFAADQFGRERIAARRIDPQHDRLDALVLARVAQQFRRGIAADRAGRLIAADYFAFGDYDRDLRTRVGQMLALDLRRVVEEIDLAERVAVFYAFRDQQIARLIVGRELIDELLLQRELREIAADRLEVARIVLDVRGDLLRIKLARSRDVGEPVGPYPIQPVQIGFLRFRRGIVAHERLRGGLVFADAEQVHFDAERVERLFVVSAVAA